MHFRHELAHGAAPNEVFAMLADPAFRERVSESLDVVSIDTEHEIGRAWLAGERA